MASDVAIAIRQADALARLQAAAAELCARHNLAARDLAPAHRDSGIARALQLEALAGLLEDLVAASNPAPVRAKREVADGSKP